MNSIIFERNPASTDEHKSDVTENRAIIDGFIWSKPSPHIENMVDADFGHGTNEFYEKSHTDIRPPVEILELEKSKSCLLKKYEGIVFEVGEDTFHARFRENPSDTELIEAEFDRGELDSGCNSALGVGMPIVWSVVRERRKGGLQRSSIIYLRRSLTASAKEIEKEEETLESIFG